MKETIGTHPIRLKDLQPAILNSALIQAVLLIFASLIMDGGGVLTFFLSAVVTHWIIFAIISRRRRNNLTGTDRVLLTSGFAIYLVALPLLGWILQTIDLMLHR